MDTNSHRSVEAIAGHFGHGWRKGLQHEAETLESIQTRPAESGTDDRYDWASVHHCQMRRARVRGTEETSLYLRCLDYYRRHEHGNYEARR